MPPVRKAGGSAFRKDVSFVQKDGDEQIAAGIVMVPDKADLQNDFATEETIRAFAEQFEAFEEAGEAGGGIMHAVFPSEWMDLERNEVLDEAEEIGGQEAPAGAWVQEWRITEDALWELILDDILSGYSIGAIQVDWQGPYEQDEVDVDTSEIPDGELVWQLIDGLIREVSTVDIPAVPDAEILETKAATEKRLGDYLGDPNGFVEEAMERGHSEEEAERLWDVLSTAAEIEGADEPGKQSALTRAAKAFLDTLTGSGDGTVSDPPSDDSSSDKNAGTPATVTKEDTVGVDVFRVTAADDDDTDYDGDLLGMGVDFPEHDVYVDWRTDAFPDPLEDAHVSVYGSVEDLEQATGNAIESLDTIESPTDSLAAMAQRIHRKAVEQADNHAPGGDTPDDGGADDVDAAADDTDSNDTNMSDDSDDGGSGAKELAEQNAEQISELTAAVENLTETIAGPQPKTAEIEIGGETYEVREDAAKAALGVDEETSVADAIERLNDKVETVNSRIDGINRQGGGSGQVDAAAAAESNGDGNGESTLDDLGKALS